MWGARCGADSAARVTGRRASAGCGSMAHGDDLSRDDRRGYGDGHQNGEEIGLDFEHGEGNQHGEIEQDRQGGNPPPGIDLPVDGEEHPTLHRDVHAEIQQRADRGDLAEVAVSYTHLTLPTIY